MTLAFPPLLAGTAQADEGFDLGVSAGPFFTGPAEPTGTQVSVVPRLSHGYGDDILHSEFELGVSPGKVGIATLFASAARGADNASDVCYGLRAPAGGAECAELIARSTAIMAGADRARRMGRTLPPVARGSGGDISERIEKAMGCSAHDRRSGIH